MTFLQQGQVYFPMRLYEPRNICMGKLFRISDDFSSEATEPNLLKFLAHQEHLSYCGQTVSVVRRAASIILLKAYSSYAPGPIDLVLGKKHRGDL